MVQAVGADPAIAAEEVVVCSDAVGEAEGGFLEKRIRLDQAGGGDAGRGAEKGVHDSQEDLGPEPEEWVFFGWNLEIGEEPEAIGTSALGEARNHGFEGFGWKTIEEKVAGNEIELPGGRLPFEDVCLDKFNAGVVQFGAAEGFAGAVNHFGALLDDGDPGGGVELEKRDQEAAVPLAQEEDGAGVKSAVEKGGSAFLQILAGAELLHPAIMAGQKIEAHAVAGAWNSQRCHQKPAMRAPAA